MFCRTRATQNRCSFQSKFRVKSSNFELTLNSLTIVDSKTSDVPSYSPKNSRVWAKPKNKVPLPGEYQRIGAGQCRVKTGD